MVESLSERLQRERLIVVEVMKEAGRIRVKEAAESCREISCGGEVIVEASEGPTGGLEALSPGDIIRIESGEVSPRRIVVVRRVWEELTSPEF
jgi:hypothetical protein